MSEDESSRRSYCPTIRTARLTLRMPRRGDREFFASLDSDSEVMRFIHTGPINLQSALSYADAIIGMAPSRIHFHRWLVELSNAGTPVGWIELTKFRQGHLRDDLGDDIQLGYQFAPAFWQRGYATEAGQAALSYAFDRLEYLDRVVAFVRPDHITSHNVLRKLGFKPAGHCRDDASQTCDFLVVTAEAFKLLRADPPKP